MTGVSTLIEQARTLGATLHVQGETVHFKAPAPLPPALIEALRQQKAEVRRHLIIEDAYALADKVGDALGLTDPLVREINRLSWAVQDLRDAGEPEAVWKPLQEKYRQMERQWEGGKAP